MAFDGLNQLILVSGLGGSDARRTPIDMVVGSKVMIGLMAGAAGVLAIAAAARDSTATNSLSTLRAPSDAEAVTTRPATCARQRASCEFPDEPC